MARAVPNVGWTKLFPHAIMGTAPRPSSVIRCSWFVRLWRNLQQTLMVLRCMVSLLTSLVYCIQGPFPYCHSSVHVALGPAVGLEVGQAIVWHESVMAVLNHSLMVLLVHYLSLMAVCHSFTFTASSVQRKANHGVIMLFLIFSVSECNSWLLMQIE